MKTLKMVIKENLEEIIECLENYDEGGRLEFENLLGKNYFVGYDFELEFKSDKNEMIKQLREGEFDCLELFDVKIKTYNKEEMIKNSLCLDLFLKDSSRSIRQAVANQGYGLDILVNDESEYVRYEVANQGYGLDILVNDSKGFVAEHASNFLAELKSIRNLKGRENNEYIKMASEIGVFKTIKEIVGVGFRSFPDGFKYGNYDAGTGIGQCTTIISKLENTGFLAIEEAYFEFVSNYETKGRGSYLELRIFFEDSVKELLGKEEGGITIYVDGLGDEDGSLSEILDFYFSDGLAIFEKFNSKEMLLDAVRERIIYKDEEADLELNRIEKLMGENEGFKEKLSACSWHYEEAPKLRKLLGMD